MPAEKLPCVDVFCVCNFVCPEQSQSVFFFLLRWCGHIISILSTNLIRYRGPCWFCCRSCLSCSKHPSVMLDVLYICLVGSRATTDTRKEKQSCTGKARH